MEFAYTGRSTRAIHSMLNAWYGRAEGLSVARPDEHVSRTTKCRQLLLIGTVRYYEIPAGPIKHYLIGDSAICHPNTPAVRASYWYGLCQQEKAINCSAAVSATERYSVTYTL